MVKLKLAIGYVAASGMFYVGQCSMIKPLRNLNELFAELSLTSNEADIQAFFERPMSNPTIFTNLGVYASPSIIRQTELSYMLDFWKDERHNGAVVLVFKDKAWHIMSRFPLIQTDTLIPLHEFLHQHYQQQGLNQKQLEQLNLSSKNPFIPLPDLAATKPFYYQVA